MSNIPLNIDFQQVILHLLNFAVLFAIIYFLLYKPVKKFMDKRKSEYEEMDRQASDQLAQAQQLKESYEEKLRSADEEISSKLSDARQQSQKLCSDMQEKAKLEAQEILIKARKQAESDKEKIIREAQDSVVKAAQDAARKAVFDNSSDAFDEFLKRAEQEKKQNG